MSPEVEIESERSSNTTKIETNIAIPVIYEIHGQKEVLTQQRLKHTAFVT